MSEQPVIFIYVNDAGDQLGLAENSNSCVAGFTVSTVQGDHFPEVEISPKYIPDIIHELMSQFQRLVPDDVERAKLLNASIARRRA